MSDRRMTEEELEEYLKDETVSPHLRAIAYLSREFTKEVRKSNRKKSEKKE